MSNLFALFGQKMQKKCKVHKQKMPKKGNAMNDWLLYITKTSKQKHKQTEISENPLYMYSVLSVVNNRGRYGY